MKMKMAVWWMMALCVMGVVSALGINQDYPSTFMVHPNEDTIYGIRVVNPTEKCVSFNITNMDNLGVSQIIDEQATYYLSPNSTQKIFIKITAPQSEERKKYTIKYLFKEISGADTNAMIDIGVGAQSAINVEVVPSSDEISGDLPQTHTEVEMSEANDNIQFCNIPLAPKEKEMGLIEKTVVTGENLVKSEKKDILVANIVNKDDVVASVGTSQDWLIILIGIMGLCVFGFFGFITYRVMLKRRLKKENEYG